LKAYEGNLTFFLNDDQDLSRGFSSLLEPYKIDIGVIFTLDVVHIDSREDAKRHVIVRLMTQIRTQ